MIKDYIRKNRDLSLTLGVVMILVVLFAPIPQAALDVAIIINFGLALTILLLTFYVTRPIDFSTFPSLLLIATLFRLALNVAATRLILTGADAGEVIGSIGAFAVGGNFIVGLVVFSILIVVQFVVVTSGAQRVSEVAARFTLDSLPGQQMSIDADLNMGLIDQTEAVRRRSDLQKEASFYGAMDGASKFVKGDAIAGIIIVLIDIIAGWAIGVAQMGMSWDEALQQFSLLTIGDGIATQLPALIISIATGIIVTRSSADNELGSEVLAQLSSIPRIPMMVAGILTCLLLLPGMPKWPILIIVGATGGIWWYLRANSRVTSGMLPTDEDHASDDSQSGPKPLLQIAFGPQLTDAWKGEHPLLLERIGTLRDAHERKFGHRLPAVSLVDGSGLGDLEYEIRLFGTRYSGGELHPNRLLAIRSTEANVAVTGIETTDPTYGLPALWIERQSQAEAQDGGFTVIDPMTVLITHLSETVKTENSSLLTRAATIKMIDGVRERQPGLIEDIIPNTLAVGEVQMLLKTLLEEGVSIANIDFIMENLLDLARNEKDPIQLSELLRQRMANFICNGLRERHKDLAVLSLDPSLENQIVRQISVEGMGKSMPIDPGLVERVVKKLSPLAAEMQKLGRNPVLLCSGEIRRALKAAIRRALPDVFVLSVNEIPMNINLTSFGVVRLDNPESSL